MRRQRDVYGAVVLLSLCGAAGPAFADGSLPSEEQIHAFLLKVACLGVLAILVLFVAFRGFMHLTGAAERKRQARAALPQIPTARVVEPASSDRDADRP